MSQLTTTAADSPILREQRRLNSLLARSRRRMLAYPCPFYVSRFLRCVRQVVLLEDLLLLSIPQAHDEQVYALANPAPPFGSDLPLYC
jgi:hypothetical protein